MSIKTAVIILGGSIAGFVLFGYVVGHAAKNMVKSGADSYGDLINQ